MLKGSLKWPPIRKGSSWDCSVQRFSMKKLFIFLSYTTFQKEQRASCRMRITQESHRSISRWRISERISERIWFETLSSKISSSHYLTRVSRGAWSRDPTKTVGRQMIARFCDRSLKCAMQTNTLHAHFLLASKWLGADDRTFIIRLSAVLFTCEHFLASKL